MAMSKYLFVCLHRVSVPVLSCSSRARETKTQDGMMAFNCFKSSHQCVYVCAHPIPPDPVYMRSEAGIRHLPYFLEKGFLTESGA